MANAYLICGASGSGKRELAKRLAETLTGGTKGFDHPDIHLLEPESKSRRITIDRMRDLERELQMRSLFGGYKIAVIVDADRMVAGAANAFLKTLEEPPGKSMIFLLTTQPEALLDTIISRCISVPLMVNAKLEITSAQKAVLQAFSDFFQAKKIGVSEAILFSSAFMQILQSERLEIQKTCAAEFKEEEKRYKKTTEGKWLEEREKFYDALGKARALEIRSQLTAVLEQWLGDALRSREQPDAPLDFPQFAEQTSRLASRRTTAQLLNGIEKIEAWRGYLERNVQEQLAVEAVMIGFSEEE